MEEDNTSRPVCPLKIYKLLWKFQLQSVFPDVYIIYIIYKAAITLPTCSASAKRSFSQVKLIKTRIHSTRGEDRFEHLMLIRCEGDVELSKEAIEKAIDYLCAFSSEFASKLSYSWTVVFAYLKISSQSNQNCDL